MSASTSPVAAGRADAGPQTVRFCDDGPQFLRGPGLRPDVMRAYRRHVLSPFVGLFAGALFDQVAMVEVAAAVDATGRFAENFTDRGLRSGFSGIESIIGNPQQRAESARWLKSMHGDVHGRGVGEYADIRYSALNPDQWLWIAASTVRVLIVTFPPCTGIEPTPTEYNAMYRYLRYVMSDLFLPSGRGRLPETWREFEEYYAAVAENKLGASTFPRERYASLTRLPLPSGLPAWARAALTPVSLLSRDVNGHLIRMCGAQVMHPRVREVVGYELTRRHDIEFQAITRVIQLINRTLPARMLVDPLTAERIALEEMELAGDVGDEYRWRRARLERRLDKVFAFSERFRLDSFAVPEARRRAAGCPIG